jgi:S-(hydroxymethyl)glutathione dehydrogenase / alcohol dehydrogenase
MRAAVLQQPGRPVTIEDLVLAEPQAGEVRVRILASGVCHSDLHLRDGEWPRPGPFVIGHEGSGVVEALGPGVDPLASGLAVGQIVALSWYAPCGHCPACQAGREWLCSESGASRHRLADGTTRLRRPDGSDVYPYCGIGTLAEATVVPASAAIPMPAGTPPEVAALIGCCVSTGVGAVTKTAQVPAGSSVAVIGLGGVGLSVVMGAVLAGASPIVAVDRVPAKLRLARELGASATVQAGADPAATEAEIRALTGGGPEFAFEAIGLAATIEQAIRLLPPGGTAVLVGMTPFGVHAGFEVFPFVDGSRSILGSNYGFAVASVDFPRYAQLFLDGQLPIDRLIERRIGLDDVEGAFDRLRAGDGLRNVVTF